MRRADFDYELPDALIAQQPAAERRASRLLCLDGATGHMADRQFSELPTLFTAGDLLVFNDTRVIPARLFARRQTGGRVEILVERLLGESRALVHLGPGKGIASGTVLSVEPRARATVLRRAAGLFELELDRPWQPYLDTHGHVPLPPYIRRADTCEDRERYQTVYARAPGAVAAPTAGLHFDRAMLDELAAAGVESAHVTLHVGTGTFQPVRVDDIRRHRMHAERAVVSAEVCAAVERAQAAGGRVVAIGTTAVRSLESAVRNDALEPFDGETRLFIYPGFRFRVVDALLTNFHLPQSTLLMLVAAFAGRDAVLAAYRHAVAAKYRFFSYGDAMFVLPQRARAKRPIEE